MHVRSVPPHEARRRGDDDRPPRPGFTIVELLVVLAIIAILMGLLLTGLRAARNTAQETQQMSGLRQLFVAWNTYAMQAQDACIPGFITPDVQSAWRLRVRNEAGQQIDPLLAQTYTWRLAGFLNFNTETTIGYLDQIGTTFVDAVADRGTTPYEIPADVVDVAALPGSAAALQPAFGYNAYYLGGWWEMEDSTPRMRFGDAEHLESGAKVAPVARTISSVTRPEQMMVFTSSTFAAPGIIREAAELIPGSAWVVPPYLGETRIWSLAPGGDANGVSVHVNEGVPLRRFNAIVFTTTDGSQRKGTYRELFDMSLWTNRADLTDVERMQPVHADP